MIEPRATLAALGLSEAEVDVYLAMINGARTARDVIQTTSRSRPTVYYALSALERRGLLSKTGLDEDNRLRVEPLSRLETILEQKESELATTKQQVAAFIEQFTSHSPADIEPQMSFYQGVSGVRNVIMETAYCHSRHIDTIVPEENFFWQLGPEFVSHYVDVRQRLNVSTRNLWATPIDDAIIKRFYTNAEIKMLPADQGSRFKTTVFMYDNCVLYISSLESGYALLVRSDEHAEFMRMIYDMLWSNSTPFTR